MNTPVASLPANVAALQELLIGVELDAAHDPSGQAKIDALKAAIAALASPAPSAGVGVDDAERGAFYVCPTCKGPGVVTGETYAALSGVSAPPSVSPAVEGGTPSSRWSANGEPDPHGSRYDCERAALAMGDMTDDELANAVFLHGNECPSIADMASGKALPAIAYLTAAKDRIRWLSRRLATAEQPGSAVQGEAVACVTCGGDGIDPEAGVEVTCCGRPNQLGDCCGNPEPEQVPQPCRQCGGRGKVIPVSHDYTTPPPAPAAEQGEPIGTGNAPTSCDQCREEWPAYLLKDGLCIKCRKATQPEARGVEGFVENIQWLSRRWKLPEIDGKPLTYREQIQFQGCAAMLDIALENYAIAAAPNPVRAEQPEVQGAWPSEAKAAADGDGWVAISRGIEHRMSKDQARVWNGCRTACIATAPAAPGAAVGVDAFRKLVVEALTKVENDRSLWVPEWQEWQTEAQAALAGKEGA